MKMDLDLEAVMRTLGRHHRRMGEQSMEKPEGCKCTVTVPGLYCPLHRSAPKLLEALEGLMDHIEQLKRGHAPSLLSPDRLDKARIAIAEAKGEQVDA